jgi:suppressor of fused protein SUFU
MMEAQIVTGSVSPNGNIEAIVEQDDRCAYLYLRELDDASAELGFGLRSCWVRNLKAAPASLSVTDMRHGLAPMVPGSSCAHPEGAMPLSEGALRIVWFEEGDAAALLEGESILAIIPCWSGQKGFNGYARDCTAETPVAWPLTPDNVLRDRVRGAEECWRTWDVGNPWLPVQEAGVNAVTAALGAPTNYYAIDGGAWPPQAMLRCVHGDAVVLVTCGMQLRPQPTVELYAEDAQPLRRIELGLAIDPRLFELAPDRVMRWLSAQAKYPWSRLSWFGQHHTMPCDSMPTGPSGRSFTGMLFLRDPPDAPPIGFPPFRKDPVTLLWLIPITGGERELAERESGAELARRLSAKGHGFVHRDRAPSRDP